jgi:hypothetical protein
LVDVWDKGILKGYLVGGKSKAAMKREAFDYIFFDHKTLTDDNVRYLF